MDTSCTQCVKISARVSLDSSCVVSCDSGFVSLDLKTLYDVELDSCLAASEGM